MDIVKSVKDLSSDHAPVPWWKNPDFWRLETLYRWAHRRWHVRAVTRVRAASPRWAEIEDRRHVDRDTGQPLTASSRFLDDELTWELFDEQRAIFSSIAPDPWWTTAWHWFNERFTHPRRRIRWRWQRSKRGWADYDVWNLQGYLTKVIAETILHLRDTANTYGADTEEQWQQILTQISDGMLAARRIDEKCLAPGEPDFEACMQSFHTAMHLLETHWFSLWD